MISALKRMMERKTLNKKIVEIIKNVNNGNGNVNDSTADVKDSADNNQKIIDIAKAAILKLIWKDESQTGLFCGKHAINNLFKEELVYSDYGQRTVSDVNKNRLIGLMASYTGGSGYSDNLTRTLKDIMGSPPYNMGYLCELLNIYMYNPSVNTDKYSNPKEEIHDCKESGNYSIGVIMAALQLMTVRSIFPTSISESAT